MHVFITSIYDMLKTHIWNFIKVGVTLLSGTTICWQAHWTEVLLFAREVLFERKPPTSIKPEATLGGRIDLCTTGQPEAPHTEDEKPEKAILLSSLTKQVLHSRNKTMLIADLTKNYALKKTEHFEYNLVSHNDPEMHAERKGNLEPHETFKKSRIVCNAENAGDTGD